VAGRIFRTFAAGVPGAAAPQALAARPVLARLSAVQNSAAALVQPALIRRPGEKLEHDTGLRQEAVDDMDGTPLARMLPSVIGGPL